MADENTSRIWPVLLIIAGVWFSIDALTRSGETGWGRVAFGVGIVLLGAALLRKQPDLGEGGDDWDFDGD